MRTRNIVFILASVFTSLVACGDDSDSAPGAEGGRTSTGGRDSGGNGGAPTDPGTGGDGGLGVAGQPDGSGGQGAASGGVSGGDSGGVAEAGSAGQAAGGGGEGGTSTAGQGGVGGEAGAGGSVGTPTAVTVLNFDFESPLLNDDAWTNNSVPSWIGTNNDATDNFGVFNPPATYFSAQAPSGQNVLYIERGGVHQTLAVNLVAGTTYRLTAKLGDSLVDPIPGYSLELRSQGVTLVATTSTALANGGFVEVTAEHTATAGDPVGSPLEIWILETTDDKSSELYVDAVELTATR
ncbi:MAG: hypothetical protein QM756_19855 [Polyangiaceae bacterium]